LIPPDCEACAGAEKCVVFDYTLPIKNKGRPSKSWRWEIYAAGRQSEFFETMSEASHMARQQWRNSGQIDPLDAAIGLALRFGSLLGVKQISNKHHNRWLLPERTSWDRNLSLYATEIADDREDTLLDLRFGTTRQIGERLYCRVRIMLVRHRRREVALVPWHSPSL
jgi:hypothetical protein